jgi:hypothetical protein
LAFAGNAKGRIFFIILLKTIFNKKEEKMKKFLVAMFLGIFSIVMVQGAHADRRSYVWTYEYMTMPKGMLEIETYVTFAIPKLEDSENNTIKPQVEFEYGITDRFDIALYQNWKIENSKSDSHGEYDGFKIRSRYRIGEKGKYFVDPLLYLEYKRNDDFHKPHKIEAKVILAKDLGNFNISYNQVFERNLENEGKSEHKYASGVSYSFNPRFKLSVESKGDYTDNKYSVGPTVSYYFGKFWAALGVQAGLTDKTDEFQSRLIVGVPF